MNIQSFVFILLMAASWICGRVSWICVLVSFFIRKILGHFICKYSFCFILSFPSGVYMYYLFSFCPTHLLCFFLYFSFLLSLCFSLDIFFFLFFFASWCSLQILNSWPGMEPVPPAVEPWSPNHWTPGEFPIGHFCSSLVLSSVSNLY